MLTGRKKKFIEKFKKTLGNVTATCEAIKIARATYYNWRDEDPEFRAAADETAESVLDMAESSLYKQVQSGNPTATIFLLKCKGAKRGYVEKQQIDVNANLTDKPMSHEEAVAFMEDLEKNL